MPRYPRGERGLLRPRGRGRGWIPTTRAGKRGRPDNDRENTDQPAKRGNRGRGRPARGHLLTGANRVPVNQRPVVQIVEDMEGEMETVTGHGPGGQPGPGGGRRGPAPAGPKTGGPVAPAALLILYLNAQSIISKMDELAICFSEVGPDLILICETWCRPDITAAFLQLPGYELIPDLRKDREDTVNGVGGGLLVYARNGLVVLKCDTGCVFNQHCSFKVMTEKDQLNITLVYCPPPLGPHL